jgi:hypothetical protein
MKIPLQGFRRDYTLLMKKGGARIEFQAENATDALRHALSALPRGSSASLVEDGVTLAEISYSSEGFWTISDGAAEGT